MRLLLALFLLLSACARQPLSRDQQGAIDQVGAASLFGHDLAVDVSQHKLLGTGASSVDVSAWNLDAAFRDRLKSAVEERGRKFIPFDVPQADLEKAAGMRESRWQKVVGKQSQALLDRLFDSADRQGIRYFFLLTPSASRDRYALHSGNVGVACEGGRASVYFFLEAALWEVKARKKVFDVTVNPADTAGMTFADCKAVSDLKEPEKQLEEPVKRTLGLVVDGLFDKLGWNKPGT